MQLSRRLLAVAALVTSGGTVADIGTDHAYLPICLTEEKRITHAIAMDVNPGPLERARGHIAQHGLGTSIETRRSDGLAALQPGEADSIVIAGMGGALTVRLLTEGKEKLEGCRELILQPQSEIWLVRAWLAENGWRIVHEDMVCEDGKFYPIMRAERSAPDMPDLELNEMELRFGPMLLRERHPVLREFLRHEKELDCRILASLEGQTGAAAVARAQEIRRELQMAEAALNYQTDAGGQHDSKRDRT